MSEYLPQTLPQLVQIGFFGLAIVLLVSVTLGIAYLTWVDQRDRDQQRRETSPKNSAPKNSDSPQKTSTSSSKKKSSKRSNNRP